MTTMTLHIENPSIVPSLRKILGALDGVTVEMKKGTCRTRKVAETADIPNATTISAIEELESGKDAGEVCLDSYESFVASMM